MRSRKRTSSELTWLDLCSPKQREFILHSDSFINLAHGAVRSGKTHCALIRFGIFARTGPPGALMMLARTRDTAERNVVMPLMDIFPGRVKWNRGLGRLWLGDRLVHVVGANDAQAYTKVRGVTLAGAYCNELTLLNRDVFQTLIDRLSIPGAKIFAETNPDSPYHWVAADYLFAEFDEKFVKGFQFTLDDNPTISEEYRERIKALQSGIWYERNIEGLWRIAEGAIYDMFDPKVHVVSDLPDSFDRYLVGVDYGTANATVFLLAGRSAGNWYIVSEWRHDSRTAGTQKTDAEYSADFIRWIRNLGVHPTSIEVDPSAASFKVQLSRDGVRKVYDADNEVLDGIRLVSTSLSTGRLFIHDSCEGLIKEMSNYRWDEKAQDRGEDKPVKTDDHGPDALRYLISRAAGRQPQRYLRVIR